MTILEALTKTTESIRDWANDKFFSKDNIDSALSSTSENPVQNKIINTEINNLKNLIGDTNVSDQITTAMDAVTADDFGIYVQDTEPTVAVAGDIWIDTSHDPAFIAPTIPEVTDADNGKMLMVVNGTYQLVSLDLSVDANGVLSV